jgi:hypothetical protein
MIRHVPARRIKNGRMSKDAKPDTPSAYTRLMPRKPISARVMEVRGQRFIETTYSDGEVLRTLVDPNKKPTRRPCKPDRACC